MSSALLALINARKNQVSGIKTIKPAAGRNRYRILPGWRVAARAPAHLSNVPAADGSPSEQAMWLEQFYMDFGQHFLKDAAGKVVAVALCPEKTFGKPCQICDELNRGIRQSTSDPQKKMLEEALAGASILLNVLALDTPTPNEVQILAIAPSVFNGKKGVGGIISLFHDWPKLVSLGGPGDGCADIIVEKAGAGKEGTTYSVAAVPTSVTLTPQHLANAKDLDAFIAGESNAQSTTRALNAVASVSGLLPNASSAVLALSAFAPATAATPLQDVPDFNMTAAIPSTVPGQTVAIEQLAANPFVAENVAAVVSQPVIQPVAPVVQPVVAAPVAAMSLEDLLKGL